MFDYPAYVAKKIKAARIAKGETQQWLADKMGLRRSSIARWESGKNSPTLENMAKLSSILDIDFFSGTEKDKRESSRCTTLDFELEMKNTTNVREVIACLKEYTSGLGIDFFLYMQTFRGDVSHEPNAFIITDIDWEWQQHYQRFSLQSYDPVWHHCWNRVTPVFSDEVYEKAKRKGDSASLNVIENFLANGYAFYVAIPIHGPCCVSVFSITIKSKEMIPYIKEITPCLSHAGKIVYDTIHRLFAEKHPVNKRPFLNLNERNLLVGLVRGQSAKEIADELEVSPSAIRQRIYRLQNRLNVDNRQELCLKVVASGLPLHGIGRYTPLNYIYDSHILRRDNSETE